MHAPLWFACMLHLCGAGGIFCFIKGFSFLVKLAFNKNDPSNFEANSLLHIFFSMPLPGKNRKKPQPPKPTPAVPWLFENVVGGDEVGVPCSDSMVAVWKLQATNLRVGVSPVGGVLDILLTPRVL